MPPMMRDEENDEGVDHALNQSERDHVAIGDVRHLVAEHGLDLLATHALEQAGGNGNQRGVLIAPVAKALGALEDGHFGHADARLAGELADRFDSQTRWCLRGPSMTLAPVVHLAIHLDRSSEMNAPPKPITAT